MKTGNLKIIFVMTVFLTKSEKREIRPSYLNIS